ATAHKSGYTDSAAATSTPVVLRDSEAGSVHSSPFSLGSVKYGSTVAVADPKAIFGLDDDASGFRTTYQWQLGSKPITKATGGTLPSSVDPTIGSRRVGVATTSDPGSWSFDGATYAYQWLLDGAAIPGAISVSFAPAPKFAGRELSVRVTASRPGYVSGVATS